MFEQGRHLLYRAAEPIRPLAKSLFEAHPFLKAAALTGVTSVVGLFSVDCVPPMNRYADHTESKLNTISASNAASINLSRERSLDNGSSPLLRHPSSAIETRRGVIGQEYGQFRDPDQPIPQRAEELEAFFNTKPEIQEFIADELNANKLVIWNVKKQPDSEANTVAYEEVVRTIAIVAKSPDFKEIKTKLEDELRGEGTLGKDESLKVADLSDNALSKKYGRYGKQAFIERKTGEVKFVEVEMVEGATDEKMNRYSIQEQYFIAFITTSDNEIQPVILRKDCSGQPLIPTPPRQIVYPTPTPLRVIFPPATFTASPTPRPTETSTPPLPVLPTLPPFIMFTPTFTPVPNIPGQPGGQPENTPTPGQPSQPSATPRPGDTATPIPEQPSATPRPGDTATPFPTGTPAELQPTGIVPTTEPVTTYVPPTQRPNQNTPVVQNTPVPVGTPAELQPTGIVPTTEPVTTYVPPTQRPNQNTPVPQNPTQAPRGGTPGSPQGAPR